jgi:hypothetical protein
MLRGSLALDFNDDVAYEARQAMVWSVVSLGLAGGIFCDGLFWGRTVM